MMVTGGRVPVSCFMKAPFEAARISATMNMAMATSGSLAGVSSLTEVTPAPPASALRVLLGIDGGQGRHVDDSTRGSTWCQDMGRAGSAKQNGTYRRGVTHLLYQLI